ILQETQRILWKMRGAAACHVGSVRFVSRKTACPCDFPAGYRLNGVQARPAHSQRTVSTAPGFTTSTAFIIRTPSLQGPILVGTLRRDPKAADCIGLARCSGALSALAIWACLRSGPRS